MLTRSAARRAVPARVPGRVSRAVFALCLLALPLLILPAQEPGQAPPPEQAGPLLDRTLATLHGSVRNALTGQPVPRALVQVEGDAATGALTDADGRFAIPDIPVGPQAIEVRKPGFLDRSLGSETADGSVGPAHNVLVAEPMPDVVFTLAPTAAIHGQIELSTGAPAEGIGVSLLRRVVQDGRGVWQSAGVAKTRSDGTYRFAGLPEGDYVLFTLPTMDSEPATTIVEPGSGNTVEQWGYASAFYPDARDFADAARMHLAAGQETQANLTLALEPFYPVVAQVSLPGGKAALAGAGTSVGANMLDAQGHVLPYAAQYDAQTHTVQALLPNGSYTLLVTVIHPQRLDNGAAPSAADNGPWSGETAIAVADRAVAGLRVPLVQARGGAVDTTILHTAEQPAASSNGLVVLLITPAEQSGQDGIVAAFASGTAPGPLPTAYTPPGSYWVHTHVGQKGLCESSFTAAGANLAREPLTLGLAGVTGPMELTLRDGCARLTVSLPADVTGLAAGEEPFYTVYVVPDFDTTTDLAPITLRASTGGSAILDDLTPGSYRVYAFLGPMRLEYHNRSVLAALPHPGQPLTLAPGADVNLALEVPAR